MGRPSPAHLTFWGVRGSIPTPGPSTLRYGGETTCIEITFGDRRVIVDAGSGIRHLGDRMIDDGPADLDLLLTHTHFDHVCGLPFFCPAYAPAGRVTIQSGHLPPETASTTTRAPWARASLAISGSEAFSTPHEVSPWTRVTTS